MNILSAIFAVLLSFQALAEDFPLSQPIGTLVHPTLSEVNEETFYNVGLEDSRKSDFWKALKNQTNVKTQGKRNTCTVFSITALLESLVLARYSDVKDIDYSEQWVQYLVALRSPTGGANGSTVPTNFSQIKKYGIPIEKTLPYNTNVWKKEDSDAQKDCKNLTGLNITRCLMSQLSPALISLTDEKLLDNSHPNYNPDFVTARNSANDSKQYLIPGMAGYVMNSTSAIKNRLRQGLPLTLEINVFYGAWNHGHAKSLGIDFDSDQFSKGIVNYPERNSVDFIKSPTELARHSVLIIGFDDNVEVTYSKLMTDGTTKNFKRKGVYYIKNSWGTKFGQNFKYDKKRIPGFGMILQDYANESGQFFAIDIKGQSL